MTAIEFYVGSAEKHIAVLDDAAVPRAEELINIRGETYRVNRVTWAIDAADNRLERKLRANVELTKLSQQPKTIRR